MKRLLPTLLVGALFGSLGGTPAFAKGPFGSISAQEIGKVVPTQTTKPAPSQIALWGRRFVMV